MFTLSQTPHNIQSVRVLVRRFDTDVFVPVKPAGGIVSNPSKYDPTYSFTVSGNTVTISPQPINGDEFKVGYAVDESPAAIRINKTPKKGQSIYVRRRNTPLLHGTFKVLKYISNDTVEIDSLTFVLTPIITNWYQEYLGTAPTQEELQYWINQAETGTTLAEMQQEFIAQKTVAGEVTSIIPTDLSNINLNYYLDNLPITICQYVTDVTQDKNGNIVEMNNTIDPKLLTAAERIQMSYAPTAGMPAKDIRELLDINYKGLMVDGGELQATPYSDNGNLLPIESQVYDGQTIIIIKYLQDGFDNGLGWGTQLWDCLHDYTGNPTSLIVLQYDGVIQNAVSYNVFYDITDNLWKINLLNPPNNGQLITISVFSNVFNNNISTQTGENYAKNYYDQNILGGTFNSPAPVSNDSSVIFDGGFFLPGPEQTSISTGLADFPLNGSPAVGVINSTEDLNWQIKVYLNGERTLTGYTFQFNSGDNLWHVIFNKPVPAGTIVKTEMIGKPIFNNPFLDKDRPQELIPTNLRENILINVLTKDSTGNHELEFNMIMNDNHWSYLRVPGSKQTTLIEDIGINDTQILVANASVFLGNATPDNNGIANVKGAVYIDNELIEYTNIDTVNNILMNISRGRNGTAQGSNFITNSTSIAANGTTTVFTMPITVIGNLVQVYELDVNNNLILIPLSEFTFSGDTATFSVAPVAGTLTFVFGQNQLNTITHQSGASVIDASENQIIPGGYVWYQNANGLFGSDLALSQFLKEDPIS